MRASANTRHSNIANTSAVMTTAVANGLRVMYAVTNVIAPTMTIDISAGRIMTVQCAAVPV